MVFARYVGRLQRLPRFIACPMQMPVTHHLTVVLDAVVKSPRIQDYGFVQIWRRAWRVKGSQPPRPLPLNAVMVLAMALRLVKHAQKTAVLAHNVVMVCAMALNPAKHAQLIVSANSDRFSWTNKV